MPEELEKYAAAMQNELTSILSYWMNFTPDDVNGGFIGKIDNDNIIEEEAPKGAVLNARILWSFAAAYNLGSKNSTEQTEEQSAYLETADRAYHYINQHFIDQTYGGVYWTVDFKGNPLDTKKQVYALAFTIYAFSEYYLATQNNEVKLKAIELYKDLVEHSFDPVNGGYFEAFTKEWKPIEDLRLSEKDANEKKTMNTHLHVLEAFTTLYKVWPFEDLKEKIKGLLDNFTDHIVDPETAHLNLFFDENWVKKSDLISYGHDIEASWLLLEAAEVIQEEEYINRIKTLTVKMAESALNGLDIDGGMWYEYEPQTDHLIKEKHWWVQAEAMVGFFNAWQLSGKVEFLNASLGNWAFVKDKIIDNNNGEWFWGIGADGQIMADEDKAGLWKCPYHNSRACLEIIRRIKN